ncbi:MAG: hypothetical protein IIZ21_02625, partial [Firmicutes bacterium]|nr:hypothetical protein [Bacillota bacterium]
MHKAERAPEGNKQSHGDAPAPVREQTDEAREPGSPEQREEQRRAGRAFRKAAFQKSGTKNEGKYCGCSFSPLTGTIFEDRKIPISEWIEYLIHLFEFHSIN